MLAVSMLTGVLAAAPHQATFVMEVERVPVGTVELSLEGGTYRYRSRHLYTAALHRPPRVREETAQVDAPGRAPDGGVVPESWWLWRKPQQGCVALQDELTGQVGRGCAQEVLGANAQGRVMDQPFEAAYDSEGWLVKLDVGAARFRRVDGEAMATPADVFGQGFSVTGAAGHLRLRPAGDAGSTPAVHSRLSPWNAAEARALAQEVHAVHASTDDGCLDIAQDYQRRAQAAGHAVAVVSGLWVEGDRAFPHAWVRVGLGGAGHVDIDPTLLNEVRPETYLPLEANAGQVYLDLVRGSRHLERSP